MEIQPKVVLGTTAGVVFGAWVATKAAARTYALLNPTHGIVFGAAVLISAYVIHKIIKACYKDAYEQVPSGIKALNSMSVATLVMGAMAEDYFAVQFPIGAALKILVSSLTCGGLGYVIGKSYSGNAAVVSSTNSAPSALQLQPGEKDDK